jgi:uncharacterized repeat protein (TIGR01451 family)
VVVLVATAGLVAAMLASASRVSAGDGPEPVNVGVGKSAVGNDGLPVSTVNAGDAFRYRIPFFNNGDFPAEGVTVVDDLADSLVIDSTFFDVDVGAVGGTGSCDVAAGNIVTCDVGTVGAKDGTSDSGFVRISVTTASDTCGPITNQATVSATNEPPEKLFDNQSQVVTVEIVGCVTETPAPTPEQTLVPGTPAPTPEDGIQGGNPTPEPSQPDTAIATSGSSSPIPTVVFGLILLVAAATLVRANVRTFRKRR